jgi:hypothetical protein
VSAKTHDGKTVRMLNLIDEHSRECLLVRAERRWSSARVIEALGGCDGDEGSAGAHPIRQWTGVRGPRSSQVAGRYRSKYSTSPYPLVDLVSH